MTEIPKTAKLVFRGILFDIYQWEQKLFDGTYKTFEKAIRIPSSQIIATTPNNKILILQEQQPHTPKPYYSLIGGMIERNEKPLQNAKKELLEETGRTSKQIKLYKIAGMRGKIEWKTYYFIAKNCEKNSQPNLEGGEKIKELEVTFDEFIQLTQHPDFRNKEFSNMILKLKAENKLKEFKKDLFN